ncbi:MAG: hypothetical protein HC933_14635 [Pleurocapsa sp. SU_196_0]|nr:hypothetical protein [Pleurocapsa sp. SU_196_0]
MQVHDERAAVLVGPPQLLLVVDLSDPEHQLHLETTESMLRALDENQGRWDLSSVAMIVSSGTMWSQEVKHGLVRHLPQATLLDSFGASEAVGFALSATTKDGEAPTAKFTLGTDVAVFTADHKPVAPGSNEPGYIARGGNIPLHGGSHRRRPLG